MMIDSNLYHQPCKLFDFFFVCSRLINHNKHETHFYLLNFKNNYRTLHYLIKLLFRSESKIHEFVLDFNFTTPLCINPSIIRIVILKVKEQYSPKVHN